MHLGIANILGTYYAPGYVIVTDDIIWAKKRNWSLPSRSLKCGGKTDIPQIVKTHMQQMHHELATWRKCSGNTFSLHRPVRPWLCTLMSHHSSLESQAPLPATHMFPLTSFPAPTLSSARVNRWVQARTFLRCCVGHGFDAKQVLGFLSSSLNFCFSFLGLENK